MNPRDVIAGMLECAMNDDPQDFVSATADAILDALDRAGYEIVPRGDAGDAPVRIVRDPAILSGKPIVEGHRIQTKMIASCVKHEGVEWVLANYDLTREEIEAALAFERVPKQERRWVWSPRPHGISMAEALDQEWENLKPVMEYLADR